MADEVKPKPEDENKLPRPLVTESAEDDDDFNFAWQLLDEHDRREAAKQQPAAEEKPAEPAKPIDRLKQALANLSSVFGNSPPPEGDNEITEEERAALRELLGATPEAKQNADAPVNMYTAPAKKLGD